MPKIAKRHVTVCEIETNIEIAEISLNECRTRMVGMQPSAVTKLYLAMGHLAYARELLVQLRPLDQQSKCGA